MAALHGAVVIVHYDYQRRGLDGPRFWPEWVVGILGIDYFADVEAIEILSHDQDIDRLLKHLREFKSLKALNMYESRLADDGIQYLARLKSLESLDLSSTDISDQELIHLNGLQNLERLDLQDTKISDEGLRHLEGLDSLKTLSLITTHATEEGVARLQEKLPNCKIVR